MTQFNKAQFSYHGGYLTYTMDDARTVKFVARFKYGGVPFTKAVFLKQLLKNHTVEEYFHKLEIDHVAPLTILEKADPQWSESVMNKWRAKQGR